MLTLPASRSHQTLCTLIPVISDVALSIEQNEQLFSLTVPKPTTAKYPKTPGTTNYSKTLLSFRYYFVKDEIKPNNPWFSIYMDLICFYLINTSEFTETAARSPETSNQSHLLDSEKPEHNKAVFMEAAPQLFSLLAVLFESHSLYPSLKSQGNSVEIVNIAAQFCILHTSATICEWNK